MKSKIIPKRCVSEGLRAILRETRESKTSIFAAQASFFIITSAVPLMSLLIALLSLFLPHSRGELSALLDTWPIHDIIVPLLTQLDSAPTVSLVSFSAVTTLWSASRGIFAVRGGLEAVYGVIHPHGILKRKLLSVLSTAVFIVLLGVTASLFLFRNLPFTPLHQNARNTFRTISILSFIGLTSLGFWLLYTRVAGKSHTVNHNARKHLPGAIFASVGWVMFSYGYSLYLTHFPSASYIYGGLAAVCLVMLWIYFCMQILLLGAVINKVFFAHPP